MSNRKKRQERAARAEQMRRERERAAARRARLITGAIVAVVVVLVVVIGVAIFASDDGEGTAPSGATDDYGYVYSAETIGIENPEIDEAVEVVFYEDFICPACGGWETQVKAYVEDNVAKGALSVEYRPIAFLDDASNGTEYSTRAANAAACVFDEEGIEAFHNFHDLLFDNQPAENTSGLSDDQLLELATQAGAGDVGPCIEDRRFENWVRDANDEASKNDVVSTPTIYVDGEELKGAEANRVPTLQDLIGAVVEARGERSGGTESP